MDNFSYDTLIIGAGQAGLAMGYFLARQERSFMILEAGSRVGDVWRRRWNSLRLFTPAKFSHLPGLPFPAHPDDFPTKDQTADYFADYAAHFHLPIALNSPVERLSRQGVRYLASSGGKTYQGQNVVVATGAFQKARVPAFAVDLSPRICQLHSSEYRGPAQLPPGDVLVVGAGNSGCEIAIELADGKRRVYLSGRAPGHIPIPKNIPGGDRFYWWLISKKLNAGSIPGRKIRAKFLAGGGDPLIGVTSAMVDRAGVRRVGRTVGASGGKPLLEDGPAPEVSSIVWATGYQVDFGWIDLPVFDERGLPRHERGEVRQEPGLYFLGLRFQYTISSPLIGGVGADAQYTAGRIAGRR